MACEGQKICLDPDRLCMTNRHCFPACEPLGLELRINPNNGFIPGIPNVPPVLQEIFDLSCPSDSVEGVVINNASSSALYRTTNLITNQRYRARFFVFQATTAATYTVTLSNNTFAPFITASRAFGVFWQNAGTTLTFDVADDQIGPIVIEVSTQLVNTFGSFDIGLTCGEAVECFKLETCPTFDIPSIPGWTIINHIDLVGKKDGCSLEADYLPGNGTYLDMSGTLMSTLGAIETNTLFEFEAGKEYKLTYRMAGSQRSPPGGPNDETRVQIFGLFVTPVLDFTRIIPFNQGFTDFEHAGLTGEGMQKIKFSFIGVDIPLNAGALLKEVRLRNTTDDVLMFCYIF